MRLSIVEAIRDVGPLSFRRRRGGLVAALGAGAVFALLLIAPRSAGDGARPLAPAEAELPTCPAGHACPDPGPRGWKARIEVLLEERAPDLDESIRRRVARAMVEESLAAGIDPLLSAAIIHVESGFDVAARSDRGARGLMQVLPSTLASEAARAGMAAGDPHDPVVNVRLGIRYFARLLETFRRQDLALMAYNAGPNRIGGFLQEGGIPDAYREYPALVFAERGRLARRFGVEPTLTLAWASAAPER